jgi:hypothetical protein
LQKGTLERTRVSLLKEKYPRGVVVLHELLHELRRSKRSGLILKIDFEKAYDKVR